MFQEIPLLQFLERLLEFFLGVHHDGPVPRDRFLERLPGNEKEPDAIFPGLNLHLVAAVEEHERPVVGFLGRRGISPAESFGRHGQGA